MLWAILVPTMFREQIGYLWELEVMPVLIAGVCLSRRSHTIICPFSQPPMTLDLVNG